MRTKMLSKNLNGFKFLLILSILMLGVGTARAGGSSYYTGFKATGGATGQGYVYASTSNTATPVYETEVTAESQSDDLGENGTKNYYAWAKAVRGSEFAGWSVSGDNGNVTPTSGTDSSITVTVTSAKDATNTGTATASWTTYAKVNVTYNPSEDGVYSVTYQYNSYNSTTKEITTGDAENLSRTISSENGAQTIGSYKNDVITLKSTSGTFQGWYSDAGFTSLLSTDNPYTYTAPTSGSAAVYPKYEHVDKYYGRLTASIAEVPYSMPGGGTIFVSKEEAGTGTYSADAQTVDNVGMGTTGLKYYLHAQPNDKRYVFRGWYSDAACTSLISTNADYAYTFTSSSTNSASPTLGNVYAAFDFNLYYMQVEVEPAIPSQGMVLASDTKLTTLPDYTGYSSESFVFTYAYRGAPTKDVYVYAKPKYGYKLAGWYTDAACTSAASVASDGKYMATGSSISPLDPTIIKLYAKFVEEDKINVTYNNPDHTKGEYKAYALDIAEINDEYVWSQVEIFSSIGKSANTVQSQYKTDMLMLEAEPLAGYGVTKWYDGADKTSVSHLYNTTATTAKTVGVTFGDAKPFKVGDNYYVTLSEALTAVGSSGQITVVQNAYVAAGNYTIPKNVTLLVPFNDSYTCYKEMTGAKGTYASSFSTPSVYVTLTLGSGANVILNGAMSVSATMCWAMGSNGSPSGKYGLVRMNSGSTITLKSGSKLYAWGYITGEGVITAESGSHTYEGFQVTGYRGGNATSGMAGNSQKVFPMNQYYIQNIENKITFQAGALEHLYMGVTSGWGDEGASLDFIGGPSSTNTLFLLKSGATLTKWYDPSKDRQKYELNGDATLDQIVLDVASVSSKDYVLPLTNNMDLDIVSGTTTINYDVAIFPDVNIHIRQGAQITIKKNVYVYDTEEWSPAYAYAEFTNNDKNTQGAVTFKNVVRPIKYTTMTKYSRTSIADAKIVVDGTLNVASGGKLYTTSSGANICSENSGVVQIGEACSANSVTYQAVQSTTGSGNTIHHYDAITVNPARLHNANDSYTATLGAVANDQFLYSKTQGEWLKNPKTITWDANGGTTEATAMAYSEGSFLGELPAATKDGYDLEGWFMAAEGGTQISASTKVTASTTYYAHWTPKTYTITYKNQGESTFSGSTHIDTPNEHPTTHTFNTTTTLNGATRTHYTFGGWYKTVSCTGTAVTSIPASTCKNITLYAKWTPEKYDITYKDKGNVAFSGVHGDGHPTQHTYGTATTLVNPTKENYIFDGWYTSSDCSTGQLTSLGATDYSAGITLYAKWTAAVASVTAGGKTTYYKTLPEAFTAANSKSEATITVLQNVSNLSAETLNYTRENGVCIFDLNNHTVAGNVSAAAHPKILAVNAAGCTFTITDNSNAKGGQFRMSISGGRGSYHAIQVLQGSIVIAGGKVYAESTRKWVTSDADGYSFQANAIVLNDGTSLQMTGGTLEALAQVAPRAIFSQGSSNVTISDGTLIVNSAITAASGAPNSNPACVFTKGGKTEISGGNFVAATKTTVVTNILTTVGSQDVTITGGKFKVSGGTIMRNVSDSTAAENITLQGGYYSHDANLSKYTSAPYQVWSTTAEDKTEIGNDYNYKVVEAYTVTFEANGHGTAPASQVIEVGQKATEPTAPSVDGYTFGGWYKEAGCTNAWNFASDVVTANTTLFAKWTINSYEITWLNDDNSLIDKTNVNYNVIPTHADPSKDADAQYTYTFAHWTPEVVAVTGDATYKATFNATAREYTITWHDADGSALTPSTTNVQYGVSPTHVAPSREGCSFTGWKAASSGTVYDGVLPTVGTDDVFEETYTAQYTCVQSDIVVDTDEDKVISNNTTTTTTTVHVSGSLNIEGSKKLTTTTLVLEASPTGSGQITGNIDADVAYLDYTLGSSQAIWYDIAVPWEVDATTGIYVDGVQKQLNKDFYLIYYNGALRASQNKHTDACWQFVNQEKPEPDKYMHPGRLYMIYIPNTGVNKLRFKRNGSGTIATPEISVHEYNSTGTDVVNAGWNGIANPAIYKAYMNAGAATVDVGGTSDRVPNFAQKYVPEDNNYVVFNMAETQFRVSEPVFVQVAEERSVAVNAASFPAGAAPMRRAKVDNAYYEVQIAAGEDYTDRIFLLVVEGKEENYRIGLDLAKAGISAKVAQMWVSRYETKLCVNTTAPKGTSATYPLGIQVPADGEYQIYSATEMQDNQQMYVTFNGRAIWNLAYGPYQVFLTQGTHTEYGLKLVQSPAVTTDIENGEAINGANSVRKVLIDNQIYIIREGAVYTINGQIVK